MVRYNGRLVVPFARMRVWELMSDWTNLAAWDMNISRCDVKAGSPASGVGAQFDCTFNFNGRTTEARYDCVEFVVGQRAVFEATSALVRSRDTLDFADTAEGTEVKAEFQLFLRGPLYLFSFLLNGAMQETCPKVMKDMDEFIKDKLSA